VINMKNISMNILFGSIGGLIGYFSGQLINPVGSSNGIFLDIIPEVLKPGISLAWYPILAALIIILFAVIVLPLMRGRK